MKKEQALSKNFDKINSDPLAFIFGFCIGRFISVYSIKAVEEYFGFIIDSHSKVDSDGMKNIVKGYDKFIDEIKKQL